MWDRIGPNAADLFERMTLKKQVAPKGLSFDATRIFGEPVGIRTRDLLIKSQLLYQLSYRPTAALTKES
ncbi:MAG: hypothetical protein RLZZ607_60 [Pseudomonadota bacterium]|jgi:hypothetical protein